MATEEEARFALRVESDPEPAKEQAEALEKLRAAIAASQGALASYRKSLQLLRGSSDEVNAAKDKLRAAIAAEQGAITKNNLAILKLGGSYDTLQKAHVKDTLALGAQKKAIAATGGPLRDMVDGFEQVKGVLAGVSSGWGLLAVATAAAVAGLAAATAAAAALVVKFSEWVVTSGDALRNMQLMREAASGNAKNATAWGHQIDWLSLRVATSKDKLNELAVSVDKALRGTRVSGQGMVDTWKAVAQASAAMGDDVGRQLEAILERGKLMGRFGVGFKAPGISELQGTGIKFKDLAMQLAKDLNVGLDQASRALITHRVTMDAGAKALREVVERQFGDVNARKMLSVDGIITKLRDNVRAWATDLAAPGGALEPLLKGMKELVDLTGLQTDSGQKVKRVVGEYAAALSHAFTANLPLLKEIANAALDLGRWLIVATKSVVAFASSSTGLAVIKGLLLVIGSLAAAVALAVGAVGAAVAVVGVLAYGLYQAVEQLTEGLTTLVLKALDYDWAGLGRRIIEGIKSGLLAAWDGLKDAVTGIGEGIKGEFKKILGIASPSRVFAGFGRMTGAGYAQGLRAARPEAEAATVAMVAVPHEPGRAGAMAVTRGAPQGAGSNTTTTIAPVVRVEFHIQGAGSPEKTAQALAHASVLDGITHAVQTALRSAAIPTGQPAAAGG